MGNDLVYSGGGGGPREFTADDLRSVGHMDTRGTGMSDREIAAELRQIAKLRREDRREYNRDAALQARERQLLEMQSPTHGLSPHVAEQWKCAGGVLFNIAKAEAAAGEMMSAMGDPDGFRDTFEELPDAAQSVILAELALDPDNFARPAPQAALRSFEATPEGKALCAEWGSKAAHKLGIIRARLQRMLDAGWRDPDAVDAAGLWFDQLPTRQAQAVLRALAGGS